LGGGGEECHSPAPIEPIYFLYQTFPTVLLTIFLKR